jgi:hypothetical protein
MDKSYERQTHDDIVDVHNDIIQYGDPSKFVLAINADEIAVIAEYTTPNGPYFDDWSLAFITKDGKWSSIPLYSKHIDTLLEYLGKKFDSSLAQTCLANSTDWRSIIRFPRQLAGKEFFSISKSPDLSFFQRILASIGLGKYKRTVTMTLTLEVQDFVAKKYNPNGSERNAYTARLKD